MAQTELSTSNPPEQPSGSKRSLLALWGVILVCATPVVAAFVVYFFFRPQGVPNVGQLIQPQRPAVSIGATTLDGKPFEFASYKGQFLMVTVAPGACDEACRKRLYTMRQIRTATGKNRDRVERVWLVTDQEPIDIPLLKQYDGTIVARVDPQRLQPWLADSADALNGPIWIVDLRGNLMMRYAADADPKGMRSELSKLLYWNNTR
jgi:hypothetical protein